MPLSFGRPPWTRSCLHPNPKRADEGVGCGPGGPPHEGSELAGFGKLSGMGCVRLRTSVVESGRYHLVGLVQHRIGREREAPIAYLYPVRALGIGNGNHLP